MQADQYQVLPRPVDALHHAQHFHVHWLRPHSLKNRVSYAAHARLYRLQRHELDRRFSGLAGGQAADGSKKDGDSEATGNRAKIHGYSFLRPCGGEPESSNKISQMGFLCIYINIKNLSFWIQKKT